MRMPPRTEKRLASNGETPRHPVASKSGLRHGACQPGLGHEQGSNPGRAAFEFMTINEFAALQDFINDNTEQGSYDGGFSYMSCLHC